MAKKEPKAAKPGKAEKSAKGKGGKASKAARPKKSKIPRPVQGRGFAILGLLALFPIALMLFQGSLDLPAAAQRAALVLGGLMLIEQVVAPVFLAVLHSGARPPADEPATETAAVEEPAA
jgi:hypothetical protein